MRWVGFGIGQLVGAAEAAKHTQNVEVRALLEGRQDRETDIRHDRLPIFPHQVDLGVGHAAQHLGRAGEVQLINAVKKQKANMDDAGHGGRIRDALGGWRA
jgi:hypothetical protein